MYGEGNGSDHKANRRAGYFDVAAEYTGFDLLTPQITFWYSSGEDSSINNGSERMPTVMGYWGPSTSFLFDLAVLHPGLHGVNPIGSWGAVFSLNKISFIQDLTHRLTFTYARAPTPPVRCAWPTPCGAWATTCRWAAT